MSNILDTIGSTLGDAVTAVNPYGEKLNKTRKNMIQDLITAGHSKEDIVKFLYVSESDAVKYIDKLYSKAIQAARVSNTTKAA